LTAVTYVVVIGFAAPEVKMAVDSRDSRDFPLERTSVIFVIILTIVTLGLYQASWYMRRRAALNALDASEDIPRAAPILLWALWLAYLFVADEPDTPSELAIRFAALLLTLFLAFRTRAILIGHQTALIGREAGIRLGMEPSRPNVLLTFFLHHIYLQHKINELVDDRRRDEGGAGVT
jgi:hypothetical protein